MEPYFVKYKVAQILLEQLLAEKCPGEKVGIAKAADGKDYIVTASYKLSQAEIQELIRKTEERVRGSNSVLARLRNK